MSGEKLTGWRPQSGPQQWLTSCPYEEVFFGGARGGGKTDGVLGKWALKERRYGAAFNAIMFRRTTVSAEDAIERAKEIYLPLGAAFVGSPNPTFRMPHGGRVSFRYLETIADADEWQGRNVTDAWVEEAGQYPTSGPIDRMFGVLRSSSGVPIQMILTANPGGAGQHWIRDRYHLHPFPREPQLIGRPLPDGHVHEMAVIPSRLDDNKILLSRDPNYKSRLHLVGSAELVRAWLEGDWSAVEGAFFDGWSERRHVVRPFELPSHWLRFRSMDWGYAVPFSVGWQAVVGDEYVAQNLGDEPIILQRGCIVRYREWYGKNERHEGLRLTAEEVGRGIVQRDGTDNITYGVLDPSAFRQDGGPSIGERIFTSSGGKANFRPADNTRIAARGAFGGWDQVRGRLKGDEEGRPMLVAFSTCHDLIRTLPVLQHDQDKPEDLDTDSEDHAADDLRYACMSRPWTQSLPKKKDVGIVTRQPTYDEVWKQHEKSKQFIGDRI